MLDRQRPLGGEVAHHAHSPVMIRGLEHGRTDQMSLGAINTLGPGIPSGPKPVTPASCGAPCAVKVSSATHRDRQVTADFQPSRQHVRQRHHQPGPLRRLRYAITLRAVNATGPELAVFGALPVTDEGPAVGARGGVAQPRM